MQWDKNVRDRQGSQSWQCRGPGARRLLGTGLPGQALTPARASGLAAWVRSQGRARQRVRHDVLGRCGPKWPPPFSCRAAAVTSLQRDAEVTDQASNDAQTHRHVSESAAPQGMVRSPVRAQPGRTAQAARLPRRSADSARRMGLPAGRMPSRLPVHRPGARRAARHTPPDDVRVSARRLVNGVAERSCRDSN